jgi:hypothetical protein
MSSSYADLIVTFNVTPLGTNGSNSFQGVDDDMDGVLSFGELSAFFWNGAPSDPIVQLADLSGFGDYVIATTTWIPNAPSPFGFGRYFAWNNWGNSIRTSNSSVSITSSTVTSVAEPGTLALLGIGLLGLGLARRKKTV